MIYVAIEFPEHIALGAMSAPGWNTTVVQTYGGWENTVQRWEDIRHFYDISFAIRDLSDFAAVRSHFNQVRGRAKSFPFKDFLDYEATQSNGQVLTLAGATISGDGTYYLHKRYGSGADLYDRRITRPDSPVAVWRTRSAVTTNITGAGATVTYTTGAVAITGHLSGDTYTWSGTFKVPCRYDTDKLEARAIDKEPGPDGELLVSCQSIPVAEVRE